MGLDKKAIKDLNVKIETLATIVGQGASALTEFVVDTIKAKNVKTEGIETHDVVAGQVHCIRVVNGAIVNVQGICGDPIQESFSNQSSGNSSSLDDTQVVAEPQVAEEAEVAEEPVLEAPVEPEPEPEPESQPQPEPTEETLESEESLE